MEEWQIQELQPDPSTFKDEQPDERNKLLDKLPSFN